MEKLSIKQAQKIKKEFGTPAYLYSLDKIHQQYHTLRKLLSPVCDIFYSMKANPLMAICQYLAKQKSGCEVSSKNELLTAIRSGFKPEHIIFVGPGKNESELTLCIEKKIKAIVCESIDEMVVINKIAKSRLSIMSVMVRINPEFHIDQAPIKMTGIATQFGLSVSEFEKNYQKIMQCKNINLCGMQIYNGSRILNENAIINNVDNILKCADYLSREHHIPWQYIDIGGGLGVPYFENEKSLNIQKVIDGINPLFEQYNQIHPHTRFILELGRYLVAESGSLISSVLATKKNHGKDFAIIDAGMHCHYASTGLGSFVQRNFPSIHIAKNMNNKNKMAYHITGPLCTPGDVILRNMQFPKISAGDFMVILNVGAYGYTASPIRFLSHEAPSEVVIFNKKMYLARRRENIAELLSLQKDLSTIFK